MLRLSPAADLRKKNRAFTLIELIVVIVIIGILAAIAIVGYNAIIANSKNKAINAAATQVSKLAQVASAESDAVVTSDTTANAVLIGGATNATLTSDIAAATPGYTRGYPTAGTMTLSKTGTGNTCTITWAAVAGGTNAVSCS